MSAAEESFLGIADRSVTEEEMLAMTARPRELPNCVKVWKTTPARAWVLSKKADVTTRAATVKSTVNMLDESALIKNGDDKVRYWNFTD